jgi:hypothetical protein
MMNGKVLGRGNISLRLMAMTMPGIYEIICILWRNARAVMGWIIPVEARMKPA